MKIKYSESSISNDVMTGKEDALGQGGGEGEKSRGAVMLIYCEPNHC